MFRAEAMAKSCPVIRARTMESAMGVVKPGAICSEGKSRAEAFLKVVREYGVPVEVKDL